MPSGVRDIQLLELKDTISQLNNTISTQNELIRSQQKMLQERDAKDSEKDQLIANLQAQLDYLKTRLFGSTSEIRHEQLPGQLDLFHLQTEDEPEPVPLELEYIEVKAHKKARKSKAAYDEVFADLPTENVYVDTLTEEQKTCDVCGTMMVPIGHEPIRTELRYTEPKLERIDYYATTYECPQCKETEDPRFIKDEGTPALIPGSYASSGLAAHVMYYKYVMSMPLYRQEKDFEHLGVKISRTTMASWIIYCAENYFLPMYEYLHRKLLKRRYLMADETPIQVLKEEGRRPQSKSYVWLVRTGDNGGIPIILYNYTPTRAGSHAAAFLAGADPGQAIKDFYENEELIAITKELADTLRRNKTIDWQKRESARAKMRMLIKKLLKKHKYPPEGMEDAVQTVMTQCELWTDNNDMGEEKVVNFRDKSISYAESNYAPMMVAESTATYGEKK